ncbi:MAG TPA: histidinol-phosphate transaminase [Cyclobacteriaceae bacterium]|nr:histidinol-phosphate transaminase [Cyclobacteriaceae bacterium]
MPDIQQLIRPHISGLVPYSTARDEYTGTIGIFLDANENSFGSIVDKGYHRYPDPYQKKVKKLISMVNGIPESSIFLGNGSDEIIDLIIRLFCIPGKDSIVITPPTYGMYEVCARVNDVKVMPVSLTIDFQLDTQGIMAASGSNPKILFLCTPNNPSGNDLDKGAVIRLIEEFRGIVVIDEAYGDFSGAESYSAQLPSHHNLIILRTFSKAWGMAGLRLGVAFADERLIDYLNKIKPPYNVNQATQELAIKALSRVKKKDQTVKKIIKEREILVKNLTGLPIVEKVYPSDANFLLVRFRDSEKVFRYLLSKLIIVRNRSRVNLCGNSLRITIGTSNENKLLMAALKKF